MSTDEYVLVAVPRDMIPLCVGEIDTAHGKRSRIPVAAHPSQIGGTITGGNFLTVGDLGLADSSVHPLNASNAGRLNQ